MPQVKESLGLGLLLISSFIFGRVGGYKIGYPKNRESPKGINKKLRV